MVKAVADEVSSQQMRALMARVCDRDQSAFNELYDLTVAKVYGLARAMLRIPADAEELVVDVYERAWQNAASYDAARGSAYAWLLVICRSRALDLLRQRKTRSASLSALALEPVEANDSPGPESLLDLFQRGHSVERALAALQPLRRQMIGLAFFEGLSHQEIAEKLNMPIGTVKSHVKRALAELRAQLEHVEMEYDNAL
jgi:RNA polymerase sigma-70 factor (ECF subfamily)